MPSVVTPRTKARRKVLAALAAIVAAFLLYTCSSLGLGSGFPPSVWWAQRLNRWEFDRHAQGYREMAAWISKNMAGTKPGTHQFYELSVTRDPSSLRRMEPGVPDDKLIRLRDEALLVEAHRYKAEFVVRFVTRCSETGGSFSLIYWEPKPDPDCLWWVTDWWENEHIEWVDPQWWSTYSSRIMTRTWNVQPRGVEPKQD